MALQLFRFQGLRTLRKVLSHSHKTASSVSTTASTLLLNTVTDSMEFSSALKDYKLEGLVGQGTFGKVYKGIHKPNNVKVAVKIVDFKKLKENKNGLSRIKSEIASQSKLNHDNIVRLHQSFVTVNENNEQQYVLILEYCDGGTLHEYLKRQKGGKLSESKCFPIFYQLVDVLRYLQQTQVIHRDLKLQNILICDANNRSNSLKSRSQSRSLTVKICDFGLAASTSLSPDRYTMCGTPSFVMIFNPKNIKFCCKTPFQFLSFIGDQMTLQI